MPNLFNQTVDRETLCQKVGSVFQMAGIRQVELCDGLGKNVRVAEFRTGSGFEFDVLMDRGMDVSRAWFQGASLAWHSQAGDSSPNRFDDKGIGWLRTFPGGMVTTCGMTYMGAPCKDGDVELGIHGRFTSTPATNVCQWQGWEGPDYVMRLSGEIREAVLFGENLVMRRNIQTTLGQSGFILQDIVTNEGYRSTPHMILYHCNYGYPLLDESTILTTPHSKIVPRDGVASDGASEACRFGAPQKDYKEKVYFHELEHDENGKVTVSLKNPNLFGGLTLSMTYRLDQLPYFTQWKNIGQQEYVCGLEPGNAYVMGRAKEREAGRLSMLEPGESRIYEILFDVKAGA